MALTNGIVLMIGGLLIAVPIILHLLMQPKPKLLTFPAIRFVQFKQQSNRRQLQLRHYILLLLRCLLIAAVVLALAGISSATGMFGSWLTAGVAGFVALLAALLLAATMLWTKPINKVLVAVFAVLFAAALITAVYMGFVNSRNPAHQLLGNRAAPVSAAIIIDISPRMSYIHENTSRLEKAVELSRWLIEQLPDDSQISIVAPDGSEPFFSVDISAAEKLLETLDIDFSAAPDL